MLNTSFFVIFFTASSSLGHSTEAGCFTGCSPWDWGNEVNELLSDFKVAVLKVYKSLHVLSVAVSLGRMSTLHAGRTSAPTVSGQRTYILAVDRRLAIAGPQQLCNNLPVQFDSQTYMYAWASLGDNWRRSCNLVLLRLNCVVYKYTYLG